MMEKLFYGVLAVLIAIAVYAGGQMTALLPGPEYFFYGAIVASGLMFFGYFCGMRKVLPKKKKEQDQNSSSSAKYNN